jgi:hypothetical protein
LDRQASAPLSDEKAEEIEADEGAHIEPIEPDELSF